MTENFVIEVEGVFKNFLLPHEKVTSLKGLFTSLSHAKSLRPKETQRALKNISFHVKKGEFFGIVGRNGSGKSTLLKMLAGIYQPTSGLINVHGKLVPFIELGVGFNPELTGRENVYLNGAILGFSKREVDERYNGIVKFAELGDFMDQKLKNYSSGMQVRLAFSCATMAKSDILLIDEVLAVGDADFQRKCFNYFDALKKQETTVVFVSHDMNAIREYCDRAILIENSEIISEGTAMKIATQYTRMFEEESDDQDEDKVGGRWGNGNIKYIKVEVLPKKLKKGDQYLTLNLSAKAKKNIDKATFGFLVKGPTGAPLFGTNTKIKQIRINQITNGQVVDISWRLPNIFAEGKYFIDIAIEDEEEKVTADWWEEAETFYVYNEEKTPYVVNPSIGLEIKKGAYD